MLQPWGCRCKVGGSELGDLLAVAAFDCAVLGAARDSPRRVQIVEHVVDFDEGLRRFGAIVSDVVVSPGGELAQAELAVQEASARDPQGEKRDLLTISVKRWDARFGEDR